VREKIYQGWIDFERPIVGVNQYFLAKPVSDFLFGTTMMGIFTVRAGTKGAEAVYETLYPKQEVTDFNLILAGNKYGVSEREKPIEGVSPKIYEVGRSLIVPEEYFGTIIALGAISRAGPINLGPLGGQTGIMPGKLLLPGIATYGLATTYAETGDIYKSVAYAGGTVLLWKGLEKAQESGYRVFAPVGKGSSGILDVTRNMFVDEQWINAKDVPEHLREQARKQTDEAQKSMSEKEFDLTQGLKTNKINTEEIYGGQKVENRFNILKPFEVSEAYINTDTGSFIFEGKIFNRFSAYGFDIKLGKGKLIDYPDWYVESLKPETSTPKSQTVNMDISTPPKAQASEVSGLQQAQIKNLLTPVAKPPVYVLPVEANKITPDEKLISDALDIRKKRLEKAAEMSKQRMKEMQAQRLKIETQQKSKTETAQKLRTEQAQKLRTEEAQRLMIGTGQRLRLDVAEELRTETTQKLKVETAQKLRVETAQRLRVETAQDLKLEQAYGRLFGGIKGGGKLDLGFGQKKRKLQNIIGPSRTAIPSITNIAKSIITYGKATFPKVSKNLYLLKREGDIPTVEQLTGTKTKKGWL
jgi:hypothetical protein